MEDGRFVFFLVVLASLLLVVSLLVDVAVVLCMSLKGAVPMVSHLNVLLLGVVASAMAGMPGADKWGCHDIGDSLSDAGRAAAAAGDDEHDDDHHDCRQDGELERVLGDRVVDVIEVIKLDDCHAIVGD